jgi:hypothetical protein
MFGIDDLKFRDGCFDCRPFVRRFHKADKGRRISFDARDLPRQFLLLLAALLGFHSDFLVAGRNLAAASAIATSDGIPLSPTSIRLGSPCALCGVTGLLFHHFTTSPNARGYLVGPLASSVTDPLAPIAGRHQMAGGQERGLD